MELFVISRDRVSSCAHIRRVATPRGFRNVKFPPLTVLTYLVSGGWICSVSMVAKPRWPRPQFPVSFQDPTFGILSSRIQGNKEKAVFSGDLVPVCLQCVSHRLWL